MGYFFLSQIVWCFVECIWQQSRLFFVLYVTMKFIILFLLITCSLCIFDRIQYYTDRFTTEVIPLPWSWFQYLEVVHADLPGLWLAGSCRLTHYVTYLYMQTCPVCDLSVHADLPGLWLTGTCRLTRYATYRYMQTYRCMKSCPQARVQGRASVGVYTTFSQPPYQSITQKDGY